MGDNVVDAVEDGYAHATLHLRSFFRQFAGADVPDEYYRFLRREMQLQELLAKFPEQAEAAAHEAWNAELGEEDEDLTQRLRCRCPACGRETVLGEEIRGQGGFQELAVRLLACAGLAVGGTVAEAAKTTRRMLGFEVAPKTVQSVGLPGPPPRAPASGRRRTPRGSRRRTRRRTSRRPR